ncbi:MAG TPA: hypothetical protein VEY08_00955 [Chloroflexia bacterium]|nr:hypothetical protein [Chloroflexia bacterium]
MPMYEADGAGSGASGGAGTGASNNTGTNAAASTSGEDGSNAGAAAQGAGTGPANNQGAGGGAAQKIEFTPEQQAYVDQIVEGRLAREREAADKKRQKDEQDAAATKLAEQGEFKTLAEQRAARIAQLEQEKAELEQSRLRDKVALKHKLPPEVADRLKGTTEAEMEADAKALAALLKPQKAPDNEAGKGNRPNGGNPPATKPGEGGEGNKAPQKRYSFQQAGDVAW